jgi:transposase
LARYCQGDGVVLVEDECRIQREANAKRVWYQRGEQPEIRVDQKREGKSYYAALNVQSGKCHLREFERQISANTVQFLKGLEKAYKGKKVLLIWDGAPWHRGEVKQYLKQKNKKIQLRIEYFPPYWPKLNPQEKVWKNAKQHTCHNSELQFEDKLLAFWKYVTSTTFKTNFLAKYT